MTYLVHHRYSTERKGHPASASHLSHDDHQHASDGSSSVALNHGVCLTHHTGVLCIPRVSQNQVKWLLEIHFDVEKISSYSYWPWKRMGGVGVKLCLFLTWAPDGGEWSASPQGKQPPIIY